ncbi:hypothetical protein BDW59DRAFT_181873 [Aspergillus cavernicola]|uniref:Short-chain dehydrogenases/reductase n=1 Tax=Aspergillus cavernicola TaxID=176166 RepID=A0ABR4HTB6_9EURO
MVSYLWYHAHSALSPHVYITLHNPTINNNISTATMPSLAEIIFSNAHFGSTSLGAPVALFAGATSGIGAATLKAFAKHTVKPRAYFVGRSQSAADSIIAECQLLNPEGQYTFIQADISLLAVVDEVCKQVSSQETKLDLLFLSAGVSNVDRSETSEKIHLLSALLYYSRLRIITNLLPLLNRAPTSCVITVAAGGQEGPLDLSDFPALQVPVDQLRGHLSTLITLGLEAVAPRAPSVSFIHSCPGTVDTPLTRRRLGAVAADAIGVEESGERHLYLLSSVRYPAAEGMASPGYVEGVVTGTNGEVGSGVYSVGWDGESAQGETLEFLAGLRGRGFVERVLEHTEREFERIMLSNVVQNAE